MEKDFPKISHSLNELVEKIDHCTLVIGNFDGVHAGHVKILEKLSEIKQSSGGLLSTVLVTFDPHPRQVLGRILANELICSLPEKIKLLSGYYLDYLVIEPFTLEYAALSHVDFIKILRGKIAFDYLLLGYDFGIGRDRLGDKGPIGNLAQLENFKVIEMSPYLAGEQIVSSSHIRELLRAGEVRQAGRLLGRDSNLSGAIVHGVGRGRKLEFPR
jgi:riboflavin kinase/FMN adenylyltransferase